jgi:probable HAF family extracellular repeat protein
MRPASRHPIRSPRIDSRHRRVRVFGVVTACVSAVAMAAVPAPAALAASASTYTITDLGSLGLGVSVGSGINANAQITGGSYLATAIPIPCRPKQKPPCTTHAEHPFVFSSGRMTDLGTLGGIYATGTAINRSGEVAGYSKTSGGNYEAFVDQGGKMTGLGSLVPGASSEAFAINDSGVVAGWSGAAGGGGQHAFLDSAGKMTDLGLLPGEGGIYTAASGINNSSQVVGSGDNAASDQRAFLDSNGKMTDLGTLGGPQAAAYAINNVGQIVGWSQTRSYATHAFLDSGGRMTDLGGYNIDTVPEAINDSGVIVGQTYGVDSTGSPFNHAFIYTGGHFRDLNSLIPSSSGFELTDASAINHSGQIVATADAANGQTHAVLLNPS